MPIPVNTMYDISSVSGPIPPQLASLPVSGPGQAPAAQSLPSGGPAAVPDKAASAQLQSQLDDSLKNSGIKAEIENEKSGLVIVRFVQADTGRVILQMPPQGVLDLIAQMDQQPEESPLAGNMVNTSA